MLSKRTHTNRDKELGSKQSASKLNLVGEAKKKPDKLTDLTKIHKLKYTY